MGVWRKIKRNHSNQVARHIVFVHTAHDELPTGKKDGQREQGFRFGSATFGRYDNGKLTRRHEYEFSTPELFFQRLYQSSSPRHTTWVIMHGAFKQLTNMEFWEHFETAAINLDAPRRPRSKAGASKMTGFEYGYCVISDPPFILGVRYNRTMGRIIFIDAVNWFRSTLPELGTACGVDVADTFASGDTITDCYDYTKTGCQILERTFVKLIKWLQDNECGVMKYTAAQQAMGAYRHKRMEFDILPHDVEDARQLERDSYFGGQTEAYRRGVIREHVYQVDVNSLYPFVMLDNDYPVKLKRWRIGKKYPMESIRGDLSQSIATVSLNSTDYTVPVQHGGGTRYRTGRLTTTLAGPELEYVNSLGSIRLIHHFAGYDVAPIFRKYVADFWELRRGYKLAGNELYDTFCKLLLNSLYGKFAQKTADWEPAPDVHSGYPFYQWPVINTVAGTRTIYRSIGYNTQKQGGRKEKPGSFIAISSFVTSYARQYMRRLRSIAGGDNVFYQGVDSLIVNRSGLDRLDAAGLLNEHELGKLKILCENAGCEIHGLNDYQIGDKLTRSGMKSTALMYSDGSYSQDETTGVSSLFRMADEQRIIVTPIRKQRAPTNADSAHAQSAQ